MAITLGLATPVNLDMNLPGISAAQRANFALVQSKVEGNSITAVWTYCAGAASDVVTVTAKRAYNAKTGMTNNSIRISALIKSTDAVGVATYYPIEAVVAWNFKGEYSLDSSMTVSMVNVAYSLFAQELSGANGTPTTKIADLFDHSALVKLMG